MRLSLFCVIATALITGQAMAQTPPAASIAPASSNAATPITPSTSALPTSTNVDDRFVASAKAAKLFIDFDANHDGIITKEEWMARSLMIFNKNDRNHDGKITREEAIQQNLDYVKADPAYKRPGVVPVISKPTINATGGSAATTPPAAAPVAPVPVKPAVAPATH